MKDNDWSYTIELVLNAIRKNCITLEQIHRDMYFKQKLYLRYFRVPVIIISGCNSIIAVSLQRWIQQDIISLVNCLLALLCGLIGSVEMYLQIQKAMEIHLITEKNLYILSCDICKTLLLDRELRPLPADQYLHETYNNYIKFFESSVLLNKKISDNLLPIDLSIINQTDTKVEDKIFDNVIIDALK